LNEEEGFTAAQLIQRQAELEQAARQAVPFSFSKEGCTYSRGYIRQPVFACRTCGGGGVCAGCSVGCHADHDLIELFAKRAFRCDCGTLSICRGKGELEAKLSPCALRDKSTCFAPQNDENVYSKNFDGEFCRCQRGKTYDAEKEEETMLQCLICEDWLHESCTSLKPSRNAELDDVDSTGRQVADGPLVDHESFDLFICNECVRSPRNAELRHYLGSRGWIVCLPDRSEIVLPAQVDAIPAIETSASGDGWSVPWRIYGLITDADDIADASVATVKATDLKAAQKYTANGAPVDTLKRKLDAGGEFEDGIAAEKKAKIENGLQVLDSFSDEGADDDALLPLVDVDVCTAPPLPLFASFEPRLDVFLSEGFRDRICRCTTCGPEWKHLPFVLATEETYSPPRSQSSSQLGDGQSDAGASHTSSTYDLGMAALNQLPREQMMESLQAYNKMRDALFDHLRPFAEQGKVVDAESVREFFRKQKKARGA
jgi:E3 ubiquitin-protein ligase UBR7